MGSGFRSGVVIVMSERDVRAPATNKAGRYRETREYVSFVRRSIRGLTQRVGIEADIDSLPEMLALAGQLDEAIDIAVHGLRAAGYSWSEISARTGTTKQAAFKRWHRQPWVDDPPSGR